MISRAIVLASLALTARLPAQKFEGIQVVGRGGRVTAVVTRDSAWVSMFIDGGGSFRVRTDSVTMATWADNADLLAGPTGDTAKPTYAGAKLEYADPTLGRTETITFVRLSADSNSAYRVTGDDGVRTASIVLDADTTRAVFGAMRGEPQHTFTARFIAQHGLRALAPPPSLPRARPGAPLPRYPEELRSRNFEGRVTLSFVIDSTGRLDKSSIRVISSTDQAFTRAAMDALDRTQFDPAMADGHPVSMRTQQQFRFNLTVNNQ